MLAYSVEYSLRTLEGRTACADEASAPGDHVNTILTKISRLSEFAFRVLFCAAAGVVFAIVCSLWVGLIVLLKGTGAFDRAGLSPVVCVAIYFLVGPLGGALIGLMLPLARSMIGYVFVGFVGVLPLYGAFALLLVPRKHWLAGVLLTCGLAAWVGGGIGYSDWRRHRIRRRSGRFSPWPTRTPWV